MDISALFHGLQILQNNPLTTAAEAQVIKEIAATFVKSLRFQAPEMENRSVDRLAETLESFLTTQKELLAQARWSAADALRELHEPSFGDFIDKAITGSIDARSSEKRLIIGQLIASRLQIGDSDKESNILSEALRIAKDASLTELRVIASVELMRRFTAYPKPKLVETQAVESWLKDTYGQIITQIGKDRIFNRDDCEHLSHLGALPGPFVSLPFDPANRSDPITSYLRGAGTGHDIFSRGALWSDDQDLREKYPSIISFMQIARGSLEGDGWLRIDTLRLTRPSQIVASQMYELLLEASGQSD